MNSEMKETLERLEGKVASVRRTIEAGEKVHAQVFLKSTIRAANELIVDIKGMQE